MVNSVLITGTSNGVGKATAKKFLSQGFKVYGLDWKEATISDANYEHYICDVSKFDNLPELPEVEYIMNNAGIVTPKADAIAVNQIGYINILKKYAETNQKLKSILQIGSTASCKGYDNLEYCSSQGARDSITKSVKLIILLTSTLVVLSALAVLFFSLFVSFVFLFSTL